MKGRILSIAGAFLLPIFTAGAAIAASPTHGDALCEPLQAFVTSVKAGEHGRLEYRASWGSDFKDSPKDPGHAVFAARRCDFFNYARGDAVCRYLMEHGAIEFAANNAVRAIRCLSSGTRFDRNGQVHRIEMDLAYGTDDRGGSVTIRFEPDEKVGGTVLDITVDGY
jgi:hypothetical protein